MPQCRQRADVRPIRRYGLVFKRRRHVGSACGVGEAGAAPVQIAESIDGLRRIVAHVGSAHTDAELRVPLERPSRCWLIPGRPNS